MRRVLPKIASPLWLLVPLVACVDPSAGPVTSPMVGDAVAKPSKPITKTATPDVPETTPRNTAQAANPTATAALAKATPATSASATAASTPVAGRYDERLQRNLKRIHASSEPPPADDKARAAEAADKGAAPTLISVRYKTWIWEKPNKKGHYLGYMRVGQSLRTKSATRVAGQGCPGGFYSVEPSGYVCHDRTVSLDPDTPFLRANAHTLPRPGPYPFHYALSYGAPMYARIPTKAEQLRKEKWRYPKVGDFKPLSLFQRYHENLTTKSPIAASDPIPGFLHDGGGARGRPLELLRRSIPHGAMFSYTKAFDVEGRTFLLSTDLTLVPADRVRRYRHSRFAGVRLNDKVKLPLGWFRGTAKPRYQRQADGSFNRSEALFGVRTSVPLSGLTQTSKGTTYHEVSPSGSGIYAAAEDLTIVKAREKIPFGVKPGERWLIVSITQGTLVAYDGMTPVFTTLISPGRGGLPRRGGDPVEDSTTPLGSYRITFKDRAATMSPETGENRSFWAADVPFTQYFNAPFALHGAYWHERYGEPLSAGCVNLSSLDAQWLFGWTLPHVPPGWQGAVGGSHGLSGPGTPVVIIR